MGLGLKAGGIMQGTMTKTVTKQIKKMAERFIAGTDAQTALPSLENIWKEGISIFYDQVGSYNELYDFNSLRVGIGTDEAYKKQGVKTYETQGDNVIIKFCNPRFQATSQQVFFLTKFENLLSKTHSGSFGYKSNNFLDKTNPNTLSPKNSSFSLFFFD